MSSNRPTLDGFIPRRPQGNPQPNIPHKESGGSFGLTSNKSSNPVSHDLGASTKMGYSTSTFGTTKDNDWFFEQPNKKKSRREKRLEKKKFAKRPKKLFWRITKSFFSFIVIFIIGVGVYATYKVVSAGDNIFNGSIMDVFKGQPLKEDKNGRSNFLIIGTSEDDPGHEGADLTDSIMIASLDQDNKDLFLFSIPRDLEVEYGQACIPGYRGKINAFYSCVNDGDTAKAEQERLTAVRELVGDVLGMEIQYSIHVNYTVLTDVIDAIGGTITIDIESSDPRGYLDSQLDYQCGNTYSQRIANCPPNGHYVDHPNGITTLTSKEALNLSRARGDSEPTYGFANSNFEREKNQRKIMMAIREKALDTGTLTNISAIVNLIDALGNNLRSNIQANEIKTVLDLASGIDQSNIYSLDMLGDSILSGNGNPTAGKYEFTGIQDYLAKKLSSDPVVREEALIVILNGTDQVGLGQQKADMLRELGYKIYYVDNAPDEIFATTEIYAVGGDCEGTIGALEKLFAVEQSASQAPIKTDNMAQIILIVGDDQIEQE